MRDRLEADYVISKKVRNNEQISYGWVAEEDIKSFELLGQHSELTKERPNTNWYKTFRDSVELKNIIKHDFKFTAAKTAIKKLLSDNKFPFVRTPFGRNGNLSCIL